MIQELDDHVLVYGVAFAELERDAQHVEAKHRHPGGAIRLLDKAAGRQRPRAVEHADIVQAEEAAFEYVQSLRVFSVHPPGEIQQQLVKDPFQEIQITGAAIPLSVVLEHAHRRPGMYRRIDVTERPLVGR